MHWYPFGNVERWIMVLVEPELNSSLRILLDVWLPMTLPVAMVHDNNCGCSVANTCCIGTEA